MTLKENKIKINKKPQSKQQLNSAQGTDKQEEQVERELHLYQHRGRDTGAAHQVITRAGKTTGAADEADDEAETPGEERERGAGGANTIVLGFYTNSSLSS